jgi:CMP-N-acetylneuraminic acid synthetase
MVEFDKSGRLKLAKKPEVEILGRQNAPKCFDMNAAVHAWKRESLKFSPKVIYEDTIMYEMPAERSVDIDSELDFQIVEHLLKFEAN